MSTHVLVTGGAGYLGSVLTQDLLLRGFEVTALDNFMYRQQSLTHLCLHKKLKIVRGDARDMATVAPLIKEADVLVPLAAIVGAPACDTDYSACWETNCRAVVAMVNNASPNQLIIFPNTNSGYGIGGEDMCTEDSPLEPISDYGRSKVLAERQVLKHALSVSLRFATLFGCSPRMRLDLMVNDFVYRAVRERALVLFERSFRRNFLHVRDASGAIIHAMLHHSSMTGKAFNAGRTDANMTKAELAACILKHVPGLRIYQGDGSDPDKRDYVVSNARLEATGWRAEYSIDQGIAELVRCFHQPFESRHRNA